MLFVYFFQVGWIIGKGGETIKNLQAKSGARIQVARVLRCMKWIVRMSRFYVLDERYFV